MNTTTLSDSSEILQRHLSFSHSFGLIFFAAYFCFTRIAKLPDGIRPIICIAHTTLRRKALELLSSYLRFLWTGNQQIRRSIISRIRRQSHLHKQKALRKNAVHDIFFHLPLVVLSGNRYICFPSVSVRNKGAAIGIGIASPCVAVRVGCLALGDHSVGTQVRKACYLKSKSRHSV